jgi:acetyltransferase-like isoleucine patch superfamily enzyme
MKSEEKMKQNKDNKNFTMFLFSLRYLLRRKIAIIYQKIRVCSLRARGYDIGDKAIVERGYNFDRINPRGVHIGTKSLITSRVTILAHKLIPKNNAEYFARGKKVDTYIGKYCVIGVGAIILAGVKIGDHCVIGAGSVVTSDIPSNCMVAGNPAKIIKENIILDNIEL